MDASSTLEVIVHILDTFNTLSLIKEAAGDATIISHDLARAGSTSM